ncbi:MAG: GTP 3',8-cyclase MoaA [Chloroflexota bacterium]|jgi:cyclic pyranopterin phosphate synthase|nr:GTP 3',8-cyclase MoaA [Chloroflexota bacterium]MDP6508534.1 GTP 3',8-cyclase MoaA [Chloroflexota bacterium]MDP6756874.1 GTP 3',8-cyclase MoaA [Chloroflexota bacterium]
MSSTLLADALGRPLRDLRISLTDRCNFRCHYCMPAEVFGEHYEFLPREELLTFEEIERLARLLVETGVKKIRLTGGEPLLRRGVAELVERLAGIEGVEDIALTTNGYLLDRHARELRAAGLHRLTISLDSMDDGVFQAMNGRDYSLDKVLGGIAAATAAGFESLKINCVVQCGANDHTFVELARHFKGSGHIVRFIEFMDVGTRNEWEFEQVVAAKEIRERIDAEMPLEAVSPNYRGEVASRYAYRDGTGEIGVIASVTQPFCGDCGRLRLSTDGRFIGCLFAADGISLRDPMRAGAEDEKVRELIAGAWGARRDRYSEERATRPESNGQEPVERKIEMYQIGG